MATCTITLTDDDSGSVLVDYTFGKDVDEKSLAHGMGLTLLRSVLESSKNYQVVEDPAPEVNVEPNKIITAEGH